MRECITHFACDCLIAKIERLEKENQVMWDTLTSIEKYAGHVSRCEPNLNCRGGCDQSREADNALATVKKMRGKA